MEAAYGEIFSQSSRLKGVRLIGLPVVEIYRTTRITPDYELNHTDILLPVEEKLD